jgi:hypothetical protein
LIALICWLSYGAVRYLIVSLVRPSQTPQQIAGVPKRLEEGLLHGSRPDWLGLQAVENPRSPLSHYHRFTTWIEPDRFNDCTRSGCHAPLPHTRRKEVRAFLNMHATSLHCGACHMESEATPLPLTWYDLRSGAPSGPPPLLRALAWLTERKPDARFGETERREVVGLLRSAAEAAQGDPGLLRVAAQLEALRPGSGRLTQALEEAGDAVRRAFRGSYGAKLALRDSAGRPRLGHPNTDAAVRDWLERGAQAVGTEREGLLAAVHQMRRQQARGCTDCHSEQSALVDHAALGYPPARIRTLHESQVFQMIQHIGEGRPFYLPSFGGPASEPLASQPSAP